MPQQVVAMGANRIGMGQAMIHASPRAILAAFAATDREMTSARAEIIATQLRSYASLEVATMACSLEAPASQAHSDLLAYRACRRELADRTVWIARLRREADDLWNRAQQLRAEEARDAGRAAARLQRGEHALATSFDRMSRAAGQVADELEAQSFAKVLRAAELELLERQAAELAAVTLPPMRRPLRYAGAMSVA